MPNQSVWILVTAIQLEDVLSKVENINGYQDNHNDIANYYYPLEIHCHRVLGLS